MSRVALAVMREDEPCTALLLVFSRRGEVRIGVHPPDRLSAAHARITTTEARAFRRALSRAIREAETWTPSEVLAGGAGDEKGVAPSDHPLAATKP